MRIEWQIVLGFSRFCMKNTHIQQLINSRPILSPSILPIQRMWNIVYQEEYRIISETS